jgi:HAD superfamily hydrolase (TIGR01490 family)
MPNLALFDFDGTITSKDTFTAFVHFAMGSARLLIGKIVLGPLLVGYRSGVVSGATTRTSVSRFGFAGRREHALREAGLAFGRQVLPRVVRPEMLERIRWHQAEGDRVVVVSASLDIYLEAWCREHALELVCTELEFRGGRSTGGYRRGDCSGQRKVQRIRERYDLAEYPEIYAYGDTREDLPMLAVATHKFYRGRQVTTQGLEHAAHHQAHQR